MSLALRSNRLKTSSATLTFGGELVADAQVGQRRRLRAHAVVLDQRPRPEVAQLELAGPADRGRRRSRRATPTLSIEPGMQLPAGSSSREARPRHREVGVEQQPGRRRGSGCSIRCRGAGSAGSARSSPASPTKTSSEPSFSCHSASELCRPGNDLGAHAQLAALRAHQRRHRLDRVAASWRSTVAVVPRASLLWKPWP